MAAASDAPVLVGVGPEDALPVARLAARVAAAHGRGLHLLHAFNWAAFDAPAVSSSRATAEQLLAEATAAANENEPGVPVTAEIAEGSAVANLVRRSETAFLVVVGDGGMAHCDRCIPADSPAVQVAARAECPVLVARREPPPSGPVLVGIDGSASSEIALDWALTCATRHEARLLAVWVVDSDGIVEEAAERLSETVSRHRVDHPDAAVECHVIQGEPGDVLVDQSRSAQLVVVAARGEEPARGMLGAVSQSLLYHAPSPVLVIRGVTGTPDPDGS
ncbi:universal stress protein [Verrucosispora sp. WMMD703]|uniref:Universal stress protein n=1 Tax=Micromonospora sediminimaris TaxID=547162 RepID=A0A9W5UXG0_9ACTN|nr:universal stress protein [Micromonospora sediminimaris]GIJ36193.1 universal stress protein [Micromonospora sediminimaris]SFC51588.1 Nucleotide-binding universal stress protein, UspA family [Micromonospora sediminimaris]